MQPRDDRDFSDLMVAAENGDTAAVDILIERYTDSKFELDRMTAASKALEKGHHNIVLKLLKSTSKIPQNLQESTASEELKAFVYFRTEMHKKVQGANNENLELAKNLLFQIIETKPTFKFFYEKNNTSDLKTAIEYKRLEIYELLETKLLLAISFESLENIKGFFNDKERQKLKEINLKIGKALGSKEIMILLENCRISRGDSGYCYDFLLKAFKFLFNTPQVAIFLKKNFRIRSKF